MATRSSSLAWKITWTEEPGGLQSMGLQRVGHTECMHARAHTHTQHETPYRGADLIRRQDSRHLNGTKYYPELRGRGQDVVGAGRCDSELGLEQ